MKIMLFDDTIAAISTPIGIGGIGIIRVSGKDTFDIIDKIFKAKNKKSIIEAPTHTITYGHIVNQQGHILDEVLIMMMRAPKTFTREDVIEINCHGGPIPLNAVLMEVIKAGARLADSGEFTKRAFLNGRIDLAQVEAIMDIIESKTELSLAQAIGQLEGTLSKKIREYQDILLGIIARIEVSIDYPEYDQDEPITDEFQKELVDLEKQLSHLLKTADTGKMLREGVKTAIVGRPNVGKSSLLNALLEENKAIVTDIPGTTRDIIEAYLNIEGIPFLLLDTAGIRETTDIVEKIGVERSKNSIEEADLVLMLIDSNEGITNQDIEILNQNKDKSVIYALTKSDLENHIAQEILDEYLAKKQVIHISTKGNYGLDELKEAMKQFVIKGNTLIQSAATISNRRQKQSLIHGIKSVNKVIESIKLGFPEDCLAIDLHDAYGHLGMIVGEALKDEIINELFSRFCLGK